MNSTPCVIDVGTGQTKIGFAGTEFPQFIIPSYVSLRDPQPQSRVSPKVLADLDFAIGEELSSLSRGYQKSPMKNGIIHDYSLYEKMMSAIIHSYLSVDPSQHFFFLTEPPLNTPENREFLAELMFETFEVAGIYIGMQALMALAASWTRKSAEDRSTTGVVIDSGHGLTHIIPVVSGYCIGGSIRFLPIAGHDMTLFTQQLIRERETMVPPTCLHTTARNIKEKYGYTCRNIVQEFAKLETDPQKIVKTYEGMNPANNIPFSCDVSYERFLSAELFFRPEIYNPEFTKSLDSLILDCVYSCPYDTRKGLFRNMTFSGGSTTYPHLHRRILQDVSASLTDFYRENGGTAPEVVVNPFPLQHYAPYVGGSMMASTAEFLTAVHTRPDYMEHGAAICRKNDLFGLLN